MAGATEISTLLTAVPGGRGVAVAGSRESVSYDELQALANQVAHAILGRLDGEDDRPVVALLLGHDLDAIAGALGAVMAGGSYVALRPSDPLERSAFVLGDCSARVLLTEAMHAGTAREIARRCRRPPTIVDIAAAAAEPTSAPPARAPDPGDPALHVYTSGSTGRPKGVWHDHASIATGAAAYAKLIDAGPSHRLSLLHSLAAMASATTLWGGLLHGATIVPRDPSVASRQRLFDWIAGAGVTGLHLVPTLFRRLAEGGGADALAGLQFVRLGGETITSADWELWRQTCDPSSRLHVGYACTEAGLVRHQAYDRTTPQPEPILPLGDPVGAKEVLLVGEDGAPVAPGETGRIVIRGPHLFGGYHGSTGETATARSVDAEGRTVFVSGDLGRFDEHGRLFHAGRVDGQLKIDGHRVEPGEVEHALRALPWVRDAAVVGRPVAGAGARLAAYVVGDPSQHDLRTVRAHLRARIPAYMVPATVEPLDGFPRLPDGKVDRRALAARTPAPAHRSAPPPRSDLESVLLEIWRRVLDAPWAATDSDFFLDLGGDSLDVVQLLHEVAEVLGQELPLDALVSAPTVVELAERLAREGWSPPDDDALVVHPEGARLPLFAIPGLFGSALRLLLLGNALGSEQPFYGLQPPGMDWASAGCETVEEMAAHHLGTVKRVQPQGPYQLLGTSFGGVMAFEIARQLEQAGDSVLLLAMVDTAPPDSARGNRVDPAPSVESAGRAGFDAWLVAQSTRVAAQQTEASKRYRPTTPIAGRIVYLRCDQPPIAPERDRRPLWREFAAGGVDVVAIPGWHSQIHCEPQLSAIASALQERLASETPVR